MKSIGYISPYFAPINVGGAIRSTFFVDWLIQEKYDVTVFSSVENSNYTVTRNYLRLPTNKDKSIIRLVRELMYGVELFFRILFSKKMDFYILSSPPFFVMIFAFLAIKTKHSENIIFDVRDFYPEVFFVNKLIKKESFLGKILLKIEFSMYKNSQLIMTVTEGLKSLIVSNNELETPVEVIRNGFDNNLFLLSNDKFDKFTVVFHGNMGKFQNIEMLIEIIDHFHKVKNDIKFLVIGTGSKDYLIKNVKYDNLIYYETVDYIKIPKLISKCQLGLSLRTDDEISRTAFPVKVFEYIGVGIPIIATPISEAGEVIEKEKLGIQGINDLDEIVKNIEYIKANYNDFTSEIYKKRETFSRQHGVRKFDKIIKSLL